MQEPGDRAIPIRREVNSVNAIKLTPTKLWQVRDRRDGGALRMRGKNTAAENAGIKAILKPRDTMNHNDVFPLSN